MTRLALLLLPVSGCFYADPINQRPSLDIRQITRNLIHRDDRVVLEAAWSDPDDHFVLLRWRAHLCSADADCDAAPFFEKSGSEGDARAEFVVPRVRLDDTSRPVEAVRVVLRGQDDFGAVARPEQELLISVADRAPTLQLAKDSRYGHVVSTPINVFAEVGDPDDWPAVPTLVWEVFSPTNQPAYDLVEIANVPQKNATTKTYGKTFTPHGVGDYGIRVTATDVLGAVEIESLSIKVTADAPPCLRTLSPIVAPPGSELPVSEPTLFQVHVVADDLDPYPTVNDPVFGTTKFKWSLQTNGGPRVELAGVSGNSVGVDPASYQPGDIVDVRVEIADREHPHAEIMCDQASPTCSVVSDNACLQRQTWRVEVL